MGEVPVTVIDGDEEWTFEVERGANLRRALIENGFDVYGTVSRYANCGGRGLCSTCGVAIHEGVPEPTHWHDREAERWGYPRLSCQIEVGEPMTVELLDKIVWGQVFPDFGTDQRSVSDHEQS
ncbi:2Fe-2S iron-sulfur cluster-binding protein [Natronomonas sp.]|uniref:2Fe-2S iron-sulfur cluster-binding protein n=1 Tax=Natronomonas sp. TaxID=2184060 RepID=UPI002FC2D2B9